MSSVLLTFSVNVVLAIGTFAEMCFVCYLSCSGFWLPKLLTLCVELFIIITALATLFFLPEEFMSKATGASVRAHVELN